MKPNRPTLLNINPGRMKPDRHLLVESLTLWEWGRGEGKVMIWSTCICTCRRWDFRRSGDVGEYVRTSEIQLLHAVVWILSCTYLFLNIYPCTSIAISFKILDLNIPFLFLSFHEFSFRCNKCLLPNGPSFSPSSHLPAWIAYYYEMLLI